VWSQPTDARWVEYRTGFRTLDGAAARGATKTPFGDALRGALVGPQSVTSGVAGTVIVRA